MCVCVCVCSDAPGEVSGVGGMVKRLEERPKALMVGGYHKLSGKQTACSRHRCAKREQRGHGETSAEQKPLLDKHLPCARHGTLIAATITLAACQASSSRHTMIHCRPRCNHKYPASYSLFYFILFYFIAKETKIVTGM